MPVSPPNADCDRSIGRDGVVSRRDRSDVLGRVIRLRVGAPVSRVAIRLGESAPMSCVGAGVFI